MINTTEILETTINNATKLLENQKEEKIVLPDEVGIALYLVIILICCVCVIRCCISTIKKAETPGKVTRTATIPFGTTGFTEFKGSEKLAPDAKIMIDPTEKRRNVGTLSINRIMKMIFELDHREKDVVPMNTRIVSVKMDGFQHGEKLTDFEPIGGAAPGSHFTYQMYGGDIMQVTRYVENGMTYVAGICFYVPIFGNPLSMHSLGLAKKIWNSTKYPEMGEVNQETPTKPDPVIPLDHLHIRHCPRFQRIVITEEVNGALRHQEWDQQFKEFRKEYCGVCSEMVPSNDAPPTYSSLMKMV